MTIVMFFSYKNQELDKKGRYIFSEPLHLALFGAVRRYFFSTFSKVK